MWPRLRAVEAEWSSSRFSLRSTAQTCQPFALRAMSSASGAKYAALADVPGFSTRTFFALFGPTFRTPTLLYFAGVPGARKPASHSKFWAADAGATSANMSEATRQRVRRCISGKLP